MGKRVGAENAVRISVQGDEKYGIASKSESFGVDKTFDDVLAIAMDKLMSEECFSYKTFLEKKL